MLRRAAAVLGVLVALAAATAAGAQDDPASVPVDVDITVGVEGFADPAAPLPVRVDVTASELIVGRIEVGSGGTTTDVAIEVPAGGAKRYTLTAAAPGRLRTVSVGVYRTKTDGTEERIATESTRLRIPRDELLVGLFGVDGIETNLRSAVTVPVEREVVPVPMTAEMFDWESSVLSYVIAGDGAFAELGGDERSAVERWVRNGGRLYGPASAIADIADPAGGIAWPSAGAVIARVGRGEVGAVDPASLTVPQWGNLLRATPPQGLVRSQAGGDVSLALIGAASAGREASVPALPWLLAGIGLFVVLVGPANFFVLRRLGKPELAWVTVPMLSALFVAGFWFVGRAQLEDFTVSAASVVIDSGGRIDGRGALLLQVESAGDHEILLEDGWQALATAGSGGVSGSPITDASGRSGVSFPLEDLGVGSARVVWEEPDAVPVSVELNPSGTGTEATVGNGGDVGFWGWGFIVNGFGYVAGEPLPAGGTATIDVRAQSSRLVYEPVISDAINRRGFQLGDLDSAQYGVVNSLAAFAEAELPELRRSGVFFFGFTSDATIPVEVDGRDTAASGPGLVVKQIELGPADALTLARVQPELLEVTGASSVEGFYEEIYAYGADEIYFIYAVPEGAPGAAEIRPGTRSLDVGEAFRWETGEFEPIVWGEPFELAPYLSPGGDLVVRATPPADDQFFDQEIRLSRYALDWSSA